MAQANTNPTPIMPWESQEPMDPEGRIVWWSRLDGRYQIEVQRVNERSAILVMFDHAESDRLIHAEATGLSYGAVYGPDVDDVEEWRQRALAVVDARNSKGK